MIDKSPDDVLLDRIYQELHTAFPGVTFRELPDPPTGNLYIHVVSKEKGHVAVMVTKTFLEGDDNLKPALRLLDELPTWLRQLPAGHVLRVQTTGFSTDRLPPAS